MKILFLTERKLKKFVPQKRLKENIELEVSELEKVHYSKIKNFDFIVLLTTKILKRKNKSYIKLLRSIGNKKTKIVEIGIEKSKLGNEKSNSLAIIHGFCKITYGIFDKIIKSTNEPILITAGYPNTKSLYDSLIIILSKLLKY